jgi:hypothetical protein
MNLKKLDEIDKLCVAGGAPLEVTENGDCDDWDNCEYGMVVDEDGCEVEDYEGHEHVKYFGIGGPTVEIDCSYVFTEPVAKRIEASYNNLPALSKLVREMYENLRDHEGLTHAHVSKCFCLTCETRRSIIERMEEPTT